MNGVAAIAYGDHYHAEAIANAENFHAEANALAPVAMLLVANPYLANANAVAVNAIGLMPRTIVVIDQCLIPRTIVVVGQCVVPRTHLIVVTRTIKAIVCVFPPAHSHVKAIANAESTVATENANAIAQ